MRAFKILLINILKTLAYCVAIYLLAVGVQVVLDALCDLSAQLRPPLLTEYGFTLPFNILGEPVKIKYIYFLYLVAFYLVFSGRL